jgi:hypothetical protein
MRYECIINDDTDLATARRNMLSEVVSRSISIKKPSKIKLNPIASKITSGLKNSRDDLLRNNEKTTAPSF